MRNLNELIKLDIEKLLSSNIPLNVLKSDSILISGITGLIGSLLAKTLLAYNKRENAGLKIIGLVRNKEKFEKIFEDYIEDSNLQVYYQDVINPINIPQPVDYIIHGASITSSMDFVKRPVETIDTTITGTKNLLDFAVNKGIKGFVYISSLEVYGVLEQNVPISESNYGYLNPLSVRSSYSESKRMAECMCISYHFEYGVPVKIARLTQTFGSGVDYQDTRVFAEFSRCAIEGKDIILHTKGETIRNYCYTMDSISAIILILIKGESAKAYNVANKNTAISIFEMAHKISLLSELPIAVRVEPEEGSLLYGYNPTMKCILDVTELERLGWEPQFSLQKMLLNLMESMKCEYLSKIEEIKSLRP